MAANATELSSPSYEKAPSEPSEPQTYEVSAHPSPEPMAIEHKHTIEPQQQETLFTNTPYPSPANGGFQEAVPLAKLGREPTPVDCPRCGKRGLTQCELKSGGCTHASALCLCLLCWPLTCVPYCVDGSKDVIHRCWNCKSLLAVWHRSNSKAVVVTWK